MGKQTLERILQSQGFGTRKWCSQLIADGEVSINGEIIDDTFIFPLPHAQMTIAEQEVITKLSAFLG